VKSYTFRNLTVSQIRKVKAKKFQGKFNDHAMWQLTPKKAISKHLSICLKVSTVQTRFFVVFKGYFVHDLHVFVTFKTITLYCQMKNIN